MKNGKRKLLGRAVRTVTAVLAVIFAAAVPASAATAAFRAGSDASETFYDLTSAVAHARNGETITMADDGKIGDENVTVDRDLILDLAGHRLEGDPEHPGHLTVHKKLTVRGPGMLSAAHIVVDDGGTLVIGDGAEIRATGVSGESLNGFLSIKSSEGKIALKNGEVIVPPEISDDYGYTVIDNSSGGACDLTGGGLLSVGSSINEDNVLESLLFSGPADLPQTYGSLFTQPGDGNNGRYDGIYEKDGADPSRIQAAVEGREDGDSLSVVRTAEGQTLSLTASDDKRLYVSACPDVTVTVNGRPVPVPVENEDGSWSACASLMVGPCDIYFDGNGGIGFMRETTVTAGETFTLPECRFTPPDGKEFDQWNVSSWGNDKGNHAPGEEITVDSPTGVKALWKDGSAPPAAPHEVPEPEEEPEAQPESVSKIRTPLIIAAAAVLAVVGGVFLFRGKKKEK